MAIIVSTTALAIPLRAAMDTYLVEQTVSDTHTGRAKARDLALFLEYASERNALPMLYDLTPSMLEGFIRTRLSAGDCPSTVNRRIATVRSFAHVCQAMFRDYRNDLRRVRMLDVEAPQPLSFSDDEIFRLRTATVLLQPCPFKAARVRLILELGASMGLRCAEMCDLLIGSVNNGTLFIAGKGRKYRELPLHPRVRTTHAAYLTERASVGPLLPHLPLLTAAWPRQMNVKRLNEKTVYTLVRELGDAAGVEHAHPHRLRHTFVRVLLEATGNNLPLVAYAARHANVQSTMRYATPFRDDLEKAFLKMGEPKK